MLMPKQRTRELLLEKGAEIMHRKGFNDTGIQDVLAATGVPKGSFYHYFKSKEDFGLEVLELYGQVMSETLRTNMDSFDLPVVERIRAFFREMTRHAAENGFPGCPLGNLSQEMGDLNEAFRLRLDRVFGRLEQDLVSLIREAQEAGQIRVGLPLEQVAVSLVSSWEGALLRMKLTKNMVPFGVFERTVFDNLLTRR